MLETLALNLCEADVPNHHLTRFETFVFKYKVIALRQASNHIYGQLKFSIQNGVLRQNDLGVGIDFETFLGLWVSVYGQPSDMKTSVRRSIADFGWSLQRSRPSRHDLNIA